MTSLSEQVGDWVRRRIEQQLTDAQREALTDYCAAIEIERLRWHFDPGTVRVFARMAMANVARALERDLRSPLSQEHAATEAAKMIGLDQAAGTAFDRARRRARQLSGRVPDALSVKKAA